MRIVFALSLVSCAGGSQSTDADGADPAEPSEAHALPSIAPDVDVDHDGDGYTIADGDCNDRHPDVNPGAAEVGCDDIDNNCDGDVDEGFDARYVRLREATDHTGDGLANHVVRYTYRPDELRDRMFIDDDVNGLSYVIESQYDDRDHLRAEVATGDVAFTRAYETNEAGLVTRYTWDEGSDGVLETARDTAYDDQGRWTTEHHDDDGDGTWDWIRGAEYPSDTSVVLRQDYEADGVWDYADARVDRDDGTPLSRREDRDGDGSWDFVQTYEYDEHGYLVQIDADLDGNGIVNQVTRYTNDTTGRVLRTERERGGVLDRRIEYTYDALGNRLSEHYDYDGDGVWDKRVEHWDYTDSGRAERSQTDESVDGSIDRDWWFTYRGTYRTSARGDTDGDGTVDTIRETDVTATGRILAQRFDDNADGHWERQVWQDWDCRL